jgi:hypothetical protein
VPEQDQSSGLKDGQLGAVVAAATGLIGGIGALTLTGVRGGSNVTTVSGSVSRSVLSCSVLPSSLVPP